MSERALSGISLRLTFPVHCFSLSVCLCMRVCQVSSCGKLSGRIWMPFGMVGRLDQTMCIVDADADRRPTQQHDPATPVVICRRDAPVV